MLSWHWHRHHTRGGVAGVGDAEKAFLQSPFPVWEGRPPRPLAVTGIQALTGSGRKVQLLGKIIGRSTQWIHCGMQPWMPSSR